MSFWQRPTCLRAIVAHTALSPVHSVRQNSPPFSRMLSSRDSTAAPSVRSAMARPPGAASWGSFAPEGPEGQTVASDTADGRLSPAVDDPTGSVAHFLAIPWCRAHLRPDEHRPPGATGHAARIRTVVPAARRPPTGAIVPTAHGTTVRLSSTTTADNAFTHTLNTPDTISAYVVFYEEPTAAATGPLDPRALAPVVELKAFLTVGPGLNGHIGTMHGGLVGTILDEVLGLLMPLNQRRLRRLLREHGQQGDAAALAAPEPASNSSKYSPAEAAAAASARVRHGFATAYLNTTYVQPVRTSTSILVTARFTRLEGSRKFFVEGAVWDEHAQIRAKAEALFIALNGKL